MINREYPDLPEDFVCPKCGSEEFRDTMGLTSDGETIYECVECGYIVFGMD